MHTWTPSFYCFVLYSYQETSAKLNDHRNQEVTCFLSLCHSVEDVHTYIRFVFYEVQKHLVTPVSMLYKDIQYQFQGCH